MQIVMDSIYKRPQAESPEDCGSSGFEVHNGHQYSQRNGEPKRDSPKHV